MQTCHVRLAAVPNGYALPDRRWNGSNVLADRGLYGRS